MIVNRTDAIANFQFEDNVTNSTGGTNGTVTGTTQYSNSISGRAFDFDGSTRIEYGNSGLSNSSDLTLLLRLNADTHTNGDKVFAKAGSTAEGFYLFVNSAASDIYTWRVRNAADSAFVAVNITMPETQVYAIRCEIKLTNEITVSYYTTAGVLSTASTAFVDSTYASNASNMSLGDLAGGNNGFDGKIDDFTVVTGLLTDEDFYRYYMGLGITDL